MNRLTKKFDGDEMHYDMGDQYKTTPHDGIQYIIDVNNKLGMLEDIEDELGCTIETVYKALSDGIWVRCQVPFYRNEFVYINHLVLFQGKFIEVHKSWFFHERVPENGDDGDYYYFALSDYGKKVPGGWALTKEELYD